MRAVIVAASLMVLGACGRDQPREEVSEARYPQPNPTPPSQLPPPAPADTTGVVHVVTMKRTADDQYVFDPPVITINQGDRVRWLAESGIPHNVAFEPDSVPPGGVTFLQRALRPEDRISALGGRVLVQPGETFDILFAGAPPGRYHYFCVPHEVAGMRGTIIVQR